MTAFLALVHTDLLLYLRNRRALLMSLAAPILIGAFFGSLFNQREPQVQQVPVAVVDLDGSTLSAQVLAALRQRLPGRQRLDIALAAPADDALLAAVRSLPGVHQADARPEGLALVLADATAGAPGLAGSAAAVLALLAARGVVVEHLASQRATLEDVFIDLTGRQLRD